ncbi:hypothetical protein [Actinomadura verrucosospora]|uniref:Secreted protein n=1 Tax=Actinomadura verrucosospora TaxID=46165 RepID=A0A7D3VUL3_ACTVE|nr:hypothetical protein [Actinomadura verrucosospora]QKG23333.1 hypothetical protein ACTIVE_4976 [Actinomadura verrucosospora]
MRNIRRKAAVTLTAAAVLAGPVVVSSPAHADIVWGNYKTYSACVKKGKELTPGVWVSYRCTWDSPYWALTLIGP